MLKNFERNRQELLDKLDHLRQKGKGEPARDPQEDKKEVVVYASRSAFFDGFIKTLEKHHTVQFFTNAEEAIEYCLATNVRNLILDMDMPTDWKMSTDVFTTVKTMKPTVQVFLCSKTPEAIPVKTLAAQKGIVLAIPFSADILFNKLKTAYKD